MEASIETSPEQVDPRREELNKLQREQNDSTNWDPQIQGKRLIELQNALRTVPTLSSDQRAALHRQGTAGINGAPELTSGERRLIQEANGLL